MLRCHEILSWVWFGWERFVKKNIAKIAKLPQLQVFHVFQVFQYFEIWPKLWNLVNPDKFGLEGSEFITMMFIKHHQMVILEKFWVWPLIHCYESRSRPFQTKLMGVDQISQFRPNFTILEYLEYLECLELGQFRNFCDVLSWKLKMSSMERAK